MKKERGMRVKLNRRRFMGEVVAFGTLAGRCGSVGDAPATFPDWQEGFLDIHHIATGRGSSTFVIGPDGTTLLIDAGDMSGGRPEETVLPRLPDGSRSPGEWIAAYVERFSKTLNRSRPQLDYVLLSHFHADHIGDRQKGGCVRNGYALSGVTMVAEHVAIGMLVDRGYPSYDFPSREAVLKSNPSFFNDYLSFIAFQRESRRTKVEGFDVGSKTQFVLKHAPERYARFTIENIAANGRVGAMTVFPREKKPDENMCSCVLKLSYGAFAYYSGGDCSGLSASRDLETPVAEAVGRVDAMLMDHHAYVDAANPAMLAKLRPRVMVIPVWDMWHPHQEAFARMTDRSIYPEDRTIFATGLHPEAKSRLGTGAALIRPHGHVVIRVSPGGERYRTYVLDATDHAVLYATAELQASAFA